MGLSRARDLGPVPTPTTAGTWKLPVHEAIVWDACNDGRLGIKTAQTATGCSSSHSRRANNVAPRTIRSGAR